MRRGSTPRRIGTLRRADDGVARSPVAPPQQRRAGLCCRRQPRLRLEYLVDGTFGYRPRAVLDADDLRSLGRQSGAPHAHGAALGSGGARVPRVSTRWDQYRRGARSVSQFCGGLRARLAHNRNARASVVAGLVYGWSPFVGAHLAGHFNLVAAWTLLWRRWRCRTFSKESPDAAAPSGDWCSARSRMWITTSPYTRSSWEPPF